jgi:hypothetical protein
VDSAADGRPATERAYRDAAMDPASFLFSDPRRHQQSPVVE